MPLTYSGFFLGTGPSIDPVEGNTTAEDAQLLVGQTYGSAGNALANNIVQITSVNVGGTSTALDMNNNLANDRIVVNDGSGPVTYIYDGTANYFATVTYVDGSTADIVVVVVQTTTGELFAFPWATANHPNNLALTAAPIRSIELTGVQGATFSGTGIDRPALTFPTCFTRGTLITGAGGGVAVERLRPGDLVLTMDSGLRPIRWIGGRRFSAAELARSPALRPVRIEAGALGNGLPMRPLTVSQQHRVLVRSRIAARMFGEAEVLVAARQLDGLPGIGIVSDAPGVQYWHFLFDRHEIVFSEGARTESLFTGPEALKSVGPEARAEILAIFPDLAQPDPAGPTPARLLVPGRLARGLARRHGLNGLPLACTAEPGAPMPGVA